MHPVSIIATELGERRDWKGCVLLGKDFPWRSGSDFSVTTESHAHRDFWANMDYLVVSEKRVCCWVNISVDVCWHLRF